MKSKLAFILVASVFLIAGIATLGVSYASARKAPAPQSSSLNVLTLKPVGVPTAAEKNAVFERIWDLFDQNYPSFDFKVVNWQKERQIYQPQALTAHTWVQFFDAVNRMILTLHDEHCGLINAPSDKEYTPLLLTDYVGQQLVVLAAPQSALIKPGMIVLGVNGESINNFMDDSASKSNEVADFFRPLGGEIRNVLLETDSKPETITIYDPTSGNIVSDTMPVYSNPQDVWNEFRHQHPGVMQYFKSQQPFAVRELSNGILYVKISSMDESLLQELESHMGEFVKAKGLVIDLRNNDGGTSTPGSWFAQHFYLATTAALEIRFSSDDVWRPSTLEPLTPHISAPTAVLFNGWDASSAEMFAAWLAAAPNVTTFGERTAGMDGNPQEYPVMDGVDVKISSWQTRVTSTGLPIEQFGIAPKYEVAESYNDFLKELSLAYQNKDASRYDDVLQQAIRWLTADMTNAKE